MTTIQGESVPDILTADQLSVPVDSEVFSNHPDAPFYVGVVAMTGLEFQPELYEAAGRLRANVYIDEKHFLPETARDRDGIERDADDGRSVHFVVVENRGPEEKPRVVGTSRLILKRTIEDDLPVEHYFPEAFGDEGAPVRSAEVSRFIARHPDRMTQGKVSLGLVRAMASWMSNHVHRPAYAVVEAGLARMFDNIDLPYESISQFANLPEYNNTRNEAIMLEPQRVLQEVRAEKHVASPIMAAFFGHTYEHKGVGYFDGTMTKAIK